MKIPGKYRRVHTENTESVYNSKNYVPPKKERVLDGSFAVCPASSSVPFKKERRSFF
jgi:hypothetical protein